MVCRPSSPFHMPGTQGTYVWPLLGGVAEQGFSLSIPVFSVPSMSVPQEVVDTTPNGAVIVGTKETVMCFDQFGARTIISPRDRMIELKKSNALPPDVPTEKSHHRNWVEACLAGKKANSDIVDYAANLNEFVLLGCIPIHFPGEELVYDHSTRLFTNKEANK